MEQSAAPVNSRMLNITTESMSEIAIYRQLNKRPVPSGQSTPKSFSQNKHICTLRDIGHQDGVHGTGDKGALISVFTLQDGEERLVAERLRSILKKG